MEKGKNKISIFVIIGAGYGIFVCIIIGISLLSANRLLFIERNLNEINNVNSAKQRVAINYRGSVHNRSISVRDVILAGSDDLGRYLEEIAYEEKAYVDAKNNMRESFISKNMLDAKEFDIISRIDAVESSAMPLIQGIIADKRNGDADAMQQKLNAVRPLFVNWLKYINEFIDLEENKNKAITPVVSASTANFKFVMIVNAFVALIAGVLISAFIIRYLIKILGGDPQMASESFSAISQGDLSRPVDIKGNPDSMLSHIAFMQGHLRGVIRDIQHSSEEINRITRAVASSSIAAKRAAEEQSDTSSLSVEQIKTFTAGIIKIAEIAKQTEENSSKTAELSLKGNDAMNNTTDAIKQVSGTVIGTAEKIRNLKNQSDEIGGSAKLIAEVADQTNLLALNAAIEAARAGEHGRGFAVVADEVRKLAERTADATAQITNMINDIQREIETAVSSMEETVPQVEKGLELAGITSDILDDIQRYATESLSMVQEVSLYAQKQEDGMKDVENHLSEMNEMSANTKSMMDENVREVENLENISGKLKENIEFFKL